MAVKYFAIDVDNCGAVYSADSLPELLATLKNDYDFDYEEGHNFAYFKGELINVQYKKTETLSIVQSPAARKSVKAKK